MSHHTSHLPPATMARVAGGRKQIESRLNDTKRREFAVGDSIDFIDTTVDFTAPQCTLPV